MRFPKFRDFRGDLLLGLGKAVVRTAEPRPDRFGRSNASLAQRYAETREGIDCTRALSKARAADQHAGVPNTRKGLVTKWNPYWETEALRIDMRRIAGIRNIAAKVKSLE
jgi:hypothetical protein